MACRQCHGIEQFFDDRVARRELRTYQRRGPAKSTRLLLQALERVAPFGGATFLDVGGGVGAVQLEMMQRGAAGGTHVDASPAYLETARAEAERRGWGERVERVLGDVVELDPPPAPADFVVLDRVVCCYPDMPAMVDATAPLARRAYGLVFPRETWYMRLGTGLLNAVQTLRRHDFHVFLHGTEAVLQRVRLHGLRPVAHHTTFLWQVRVFAPA